MGEARRLVPAQPVLGGEGELRRRHAVDIGRVVAVEAAALPAMAVDDLEARAAEGEADGAAIAATG